DHSWRCLHRTANVTAGLAQDLTHALQRQPDLARGARRGAARRRVDEAEDRLCGRGTTSERLEHALELAPARDDAIDIRLRRRVGHGGEHAHLDPRPRVLVEREEPSLADREARKLELGELAAGVLLDQPGPR